MQNKAKIILLAFVTMLSGVLLACGPSYGHYRDGYNHGNYRSDRYSFDIGYREGYHHGVADRRAGHDFNYSHDDRYRSGHGEFREGYARGYSDGYYGRRY